MENEIEILDEIKILSDDLVWLRHHYNQYSNLFTFSDKRLQLLTDSAPRFFMDVQRMYWHQMIMGISRMTDKHVQRQNRNLSIQILPYMGEKHNWDFNEDLIYRVNKAVDTAAPIRKIRMKNIGHRDYDTALDKAISLGKLELDKVDTILNELGDVINYVRSKLNLSIQHWELITHQNVKALIYHLKLSMLRLEKIIGSTEEMKKLEGDLLASEYHDA
jgi:hypothetical protein